MEDMASRRTTVVLTPEDERALRAASKREGVSQSELIRRGITIPIVFITAQGDRPLAPRLAPGAVACLFKPFSDDALLEAVERAIAMT